MAKVSRAQSADLAREPVVTAEPEDRSAPAAGPPNAPGAASADARAQQAWLEEQLADWDSSPKRWPLALRMFLIAGGSALLWGLIVGSWTLAVRG